MSEERNIGGVGDNYELDELLGAFALDAVDPDEQRRVEDYLRISPRAAAEVREHREVATMLAFTGMDAPPDVWSRIENEIDAPAPEPGPTLAKMFALDPEATGTSIESAPLRRRAAPSWLGAAAAVAILAAGFLVVANRSSGSTDPIADAFAAAVGSEASLSTQLVAEGSRVEATGVIDVDGHGYLDADDLPTLSSDMTYQLWGVLSESGDVVSIGIIGNDPGLETFTIDGSVDALAITIEQAPGVISDGNPDGAYVGAFA